MKTTNWQTKALTLFIATVALWLTAACGNGDLIDHPFPPNGLRIVAEDPCEIDVPPVPSQEFVRLAKRRLQPGEEITFEALRKIPEYIHASYARDTRLKPEFNRILDVLEPYRVPGGRFWDYPHYSGAGVEALRTWDGLGTDKIVVVVKLAHLVDPRTVPPEDRIPICLAGVPVHIIVGDIVYGNIE